MSLERVEAELAAAVSRITQLRHDLQTAEVWESELRTSASVLRRLAGLPPTQIPEVATSSTKQEEPKAKISTPPPRTHRGQIIADAGRKVLEREGRRIKTAGLVQLLTGEGFIFANGNPARATTELSNALSRYGINLTGTRTNGWGLAEWGDATAEGPGPVPIQDSGSPAPTHAQPEVVMSEMDQSASAAPDGDSHTGEVDWPLPNPPAPR